MKIFSRFNDFLNHSVDYLDNRIITGKFIVDIFNQLLRFLKFAIAFTKRVYAFLLRREAFIVVVTLLAALWNLLMKIPLWNTCVFMIADAITIVITCYSELFIVFAITFSSTFLLLDWFQSAIALFFIALIPVILLNNFFISALYYSIHEREENGKLSFWHNIKRLAPRFSTLNTPLVLVSSLIIESFVVYALSVFCLTEIFNFLHLLWSGSIVYWFIFTILSAFTIICLIGLILLLQQSYFLILLKQQSLKKAISLSKQQILEFFPYYLFFNGILYISSAILIWRSFLSSLYIGFTLGIYCAISAGYLLAYLLQKHFGFELTEHEIPEKNIKKKNIVVIIIVAGFINYMLIASLVIQKQQSLLTFIQQQQNNYFDQQEMKVYVNNTYGYSLKYPGYWTVYQWSSNSVTFYNNYTRTLSGGTWLNIVISPYNRSYFQDLFYDPPGITRFDPQTGDITTKVTNMIIDAYQTVNYTYIKSGLPYKQYETHYLIHKGNVLYDIAFVSLTNDVSSYNSTLFQKIINSVVFSN